MKALLLTLVKKLVFRFIIFSNNTYLPFFFRNNYRKGSVLHISYMVHIPWYMVKTLREHGIYAKYLAIGTSALWDKCDINYISPPGIITGAIKRFFLFWNVLAKFEILHLHFGYTISDSGWELPLLKKMGRKIVVHFRGCEVRDWEKNMKLHPHNNLCEECDYNRSLCTSPQTKARIDRVMKYADAVLVTTPDMKDFIPEAVHFPFFAPDIDITRYPERQKKAGDPERLVHVTGHPGLEGTKHIQAAVDKLNSEGYNIEFIFLKGVTYDTALEAFSQADIAIGKMKMGYYANAQIESMCFGVPAITYVRPEFMTKELENSGFIFTSLDELEETLRYYLDNPERLEAKRAIARESILKLHDNEKLTDLLVSIYEGTNKS